jgi:hypothetical protein
MLGADHTRETAMLTVLGFGMGITFMFLIMTNDPDLHGAAHNGPAVRRISL